MSLADCKRIELPMIPDPQGNLAIAEGGNHVPFPIARVYFVYGIPEGARRGGHSHRTLEQVVFCVNGRLEMVVEDGASRRLFVLDDPRKGLYLPPMVWRDIDGFAAGTVYLVLASAAYDETDYIRDRAQYLEALGAAAGR